MMMGIPVAGIAVVVGGGGGGGRRTIGGGGGGGGGGGEGVKLVRDEEQALEIRLGSRIVSGDVGLDVEGRMPVLRHGCDSVDWDT